MLFPIKRKNILVPFTYNAFDKLLKKTGTHLHFYNLQSHAFKRAALDMLWLANEKELMYVSPRLLKDVGDHARDYHERYIRPSLIFTAQQVSKCKKLLVQDFVDSLDPHTHTNFSPP